MSVESVSLSFIHLLGFFREEAKFMMFTVHLTLK